MNKNAPINSKYIINIFLILGISISATIANAESTADSLEKMKSAHAAAGIGDLSKNNSNPHEQGSFVVGNKSEIKWRVPSSWTELPSTSMRLGNFTYTDPNGQKVEITVTALPGEAGGKKANFAMWRSQIGLPAIGEDELMKQTEQVKTSRGEFTLVNMVSDKNVIDNNKKARIIGAITSHGSSTWFFKMKGADETVQGQKKTFVEFLNNIEFVTPTPKGML